MADNPLIWALIGTATGFIIFKTQQWSVNLVNPDKATLSLGVVIGGAFLRWGLIAAVFVVSMANTTVSMFIVFVAFMLTRLFFLLKWQGWLRADP